jgi:hypothetical protein
LVHLSPNLSVEATYGMLLIGAPGRARRNCAISSSATKARNPGKVRLCQSSALTNKGDFSPCSGFDPWDGRSQ